MRLSPRSKSDNLSDMNADSQKHSNNSLINKSIIEELN